MMNESAPFEEKWIKGMIIAREKFPFRESGKPFQSLWDAHGIEIRGEPLKLDFVRYAQIEREGRMICIVARDGDRPVGYSFHYWYKSLHFDEREGHDDLWYVLPAYRKDGIGQRLRMMGMAALKDAGAVSTSDFIRNAGTHPTLMTQLGYDTHGIWWRKTL